MERAGADRKPRNRHIRCQEQLDFGDRARGARQIERCDDLRLASQGIGIRLPGAPSDIARSAPTLGNGQGEITARAAIVRACCDPIFVPACVKEARQSGTSRSKRCVDEVGLGRDGASAIKDRVDGGVPFGRQVDAIGDDGPVVESRGVGSQLHANFRVNKLGALLTIKIAVDSIAAAREYDLAPLYYNSSMLAFDGGRLMPGKCDLAAAAKAGVEKLEKKPAAPADKPAEAGEIDGLLF